MRKKERYFKHEVLVCVYIYIYMRSPGGHFLYRMVEPGYSAKPFFQDYKMEKKGWEWFLKDLSDF